MEYLEDKFIIPESNQYGENLIGKRISIFWPGDNVYYQALVIKYDEPKDKHIVLYENDFSGKQYNENLRKSHWKIWSGTDEEYVETFTKVYGAVVKYEPEPVIVKKTKIPTYSVMVLEAVIELNEKEGSSLNAIRKYILTHYDIKSQQKASFHNLTLKAVNRAVANNELERIKHSFRLTAAERDKRKEKVRGLLNFDEELDPNDKRLAAFGIDAATYSAILAHNKALRKALIELKGKRDEFLRERLPLLRYFLPETNYFNKPANNPAPATTEATSSSAVAAPTAPESNNANGSAESKMEEDQDDTNEENLNTSDAMDEVKDESMDQSNLNESQMVEENATEMNDSVDYNPDLSMEDGNKRDSAGGNEISPLDQVADEPEEDEPPEILHYSTLDGVKDIVIPKMLKADLHDHQVTGISWMVHMFQHGMPMILGDQMGLGKTLQTIGFLSYLYSTLKIHGPHLIVVPLSVLSNWLSEIERFCPTFRAVRFHGPKQERDRIKEEELRDYSEFEIVVTTFEILVSEINFFRRKYVWTTVIIDEGHRLKNEKSQLSEKLRLIPCIGKVILTGTPLQNNLHELWALLYYLAPDIFTSAEPFDEGFDLVRGKINNKILRRARRMLSVFMLRRIKDQVSIKLPSRKEVTLLVSLTDQQAELYRQLLCGLDSSTIEVVMREAEKEMSRVNSTGELRKTASSANLEGNNTSSSAENNNDSTALTLTKSTKSESFSNDSEWRKLMNILLQLRKICNHTYLIPQVAPEPYVVTEDIVSGSGKLLMLDRMLPALKQDGHRVLIFSQFTSMLDILEDYCELRDYPYVRLDGETNRVKRRLDCRRFNAPNSNLFIFLISTRAGGLGLNLASADTVILYDSDWNPQVDLQAMERAHRIGQTRPVRVFRLICRGSVEERMISRAEKKLFLNAMVAEIDPDKQLTEHHGDENDQGEVMEALGIGGSAMSKGELASLIRFGANAVFESENSLKNHLSEEELFELLERNGRDRHNTAPVATTPVAGQDPEKAAATSSAITALNHDLNSSSNVLEDADAFEKAQKVLKDRMEMLQEVDLRQLGNVIYAKKKPEKKTGSLDFSTLLDGKRQRKERIMMVDGKGSGYGGSVPVLMETMETEKSGDAPDELLKTRGRLWNHRTFCTLCGIAGENQVDAEGAPSANNLHFSLQMDLSSTRCAHCPFIFHQSCGYEHGIFNNKGAGMFICPHHRCSECNRSTASAGGLLFRCLGCLTAYCEDCLPQDEIESIGRCRDLEAYGYHSRQAYFIKCPSCCHREGFKPTGVLGDQNQSTTVPAAASGEEKSAGGEENEEGANALDTSMATDANPSDEQQAATAAAVPGAADVSQDMNKLPSQFMLIQWREVLPPPPKVRERKSKGGAGGNKRKRGTSQTPDKSKKKRKGGADYDEEDDEEDEQEEQEEAPAAPETPYDSISFLEDEESLAHPKVPANLTLQKAYELVLGDPFLKELMNIFEQVLEIKRDEEPESTKYSSLDLIVEFALVTNKLEAGRYRTSTLFLNDMSYVIETQIVKKLLKLIPTAQKNLRKRVNEKMAELLSFLKEDVLNSIAM